MLKRKDKFLHGAESWLTRVSMSMAILSILALILCNIYLPSERDFDSGSKTFSEGWVDEQGNPITIPSDIPAVNGSVTIYNVVPDIVFSKVICLRSSQQDVTIRVGDAIRKHYTTKNTRLFGKNSASRNVFVEIGERDAGKQIAITLETSSMYAGRVNTIVIGDAAAIMMEGFDSYFLQDISALFLLFIGFVGVLFGVILRFQYHQKTPVIDLGVVAVMTGAWRLCESRMRQFYFRNNSSTAMLAFVFLALMPIFVLRYVDRVFQRRHRKVFCALEWLSVSVFLAEALMQVQGIYDYVEMLPVTVAECLIFMAIILGYLVYEFVKRYTKQYRLKTIGILCLVASAVIEVALMNSILKDRIIIFFGVVILFFMTVLEEIRILINNSTEEHIRQQKHTEELSLQVVTALSATVDAKDRYTNGHSKRVAEYAREIAKRAGFSEEALKEIYYIGLLHDVGKIGVADTIINKEGRLTQEEFEEIKKHSQYGSDILRKVTEMPNLQIGARWHHERFDGRGYPDGLSGEAIPVQARIISVADSYDAMTSFRSYRDALPQEVVIQEINKGLGTQFDPDFGAIMLDMIREDKKYEMREKR